jgi:hypothetical protein
MAWSVQDFLETMRGHALLPMREEAGATILFELNRKRDGSSEKFCIYM